MWNVFVGSFLCRVRCLAGLEALVDHVVGVEENIEAIQF